MTYRNAEEHWAIVDLVVVQDTFDPFRSPTGQ